VEALAAVHPEGRNLLVKVVAEPYEQWPLPWYLREYKTVGYWTEAEAAGNLGAADLVIASAERAEDVENALGRPSIVEHYGLRPGVLLTLFIPPGLWEAFMKSRG